MWQFTKLKFLRFKLMNYINDATQLYVKFSHKYFYSHLRVNKNICVKTYLTCFCKKALHKKNCWCVSKLTYTQPDLGELRVGHTNSPCGKRIRDMQRS